MDKRIIYYQNGNTKEVCESFNELNLKSDNKDTYSSAPASLHRSNDNSRCSTPTSTEQVSVVKQQLNPVAQSQSTLSPKRLKRLIRNILLEYLAGCSNINETNRNVKASLPPSALKQFVSDTYNYMTDKPRLVRLNTGELFAELIIRETLSIDTYCTALEELFSHPQDVFVNNPNVWNYYAELIAPLVCGRVLQFRRLHKCCDSLISIGYAHYLLASLFKIVTEIKGPNFLLGVWNNANMRLHDFMNPEQIDTFISNNNFNFLWAPQRGGQNYFTPRGPPQPNQTRIVNGQQSQQQPTQQLIMQYGQPLYFNGYNNSVPRPPPIYMPQNYQMLPRNQIPYSPYPPQIFQHYLNQISNQKQVRLPTQMQPVHQNNTKGAHIPYSPPLKQASQLNLSEKKNPKQQINTRIINPYTGKEYEYDSTSSVSEEDS